MKVRVLRLELQLINPKLTNDTKTHSTLEMAGFGHFQSVN